MAVKYYKLAAEEGHTMAQFNLGVCYEHVNNHVLAAKYYALAADQGLMVAGYLIGDYYYTGKSVPQDEGGSPLAQAKLAVCYTKGHGLPQDFPKAAKYFALAADRGHEGAQVSLGVCYAKGQGVSTGCEARGCWRENRSGTAFGGMLGVSPLRVWMPRHCEKNVENALLWRARVMSIRNIKQPIG